LTRRRGFSVYVSAGASGVIAGSIGAITATSLGVNASTVATAAGAATGGHHDRRGDQHARRGAGTVGTLENRLQFAMNLGQTQMVNVKAAESRIRDANIAEESANLTRYQILTQSGIAALAQANSSSGAVLALLK
jgi:flagellin